MTFNCSIFLLFQRTILLMIAMIAQALCPLYCIDGEVIPCIHWGLSCIEVLTGSHFQWCVRHFYCSLYVPCSRTYFVQIIFCLFELQQAPNNVAKCAKFFRKCLELLDEPNHLVAVLLDYLFCLFIASGLY